MDRAEFLETLREDATEGRIIKLVDMLNDTDTLAGSLGMHPEKVKRAIEDAAIEGIAACNLNGDSDRIIRMLWKDGLSDRVLAATITSCGKNGNFSLLAAFVNKKGLSSKLREVTENAILEAAKQTLKHNLPCIGVASLLERDDLSKGLKRDLKKLTGLPRKDRLAADGILSKGTVKPPLRLRGVTKGRNDKLFRR